MIVEDQFKKHFTEPWKQLHFDGFKSGPHEMELVRKFNGVNYINDSKSTNVNSAWYALTSIFTPVIWITGGAIVNNDFKLLLKHVDRVKAMICIGSDNRYLHSIFQKKIFCIVNASDMDAAVMSAQRISEKGDTILLSPGCASFDKYINYEHRGIEFRKSVKSLYNI